MARLDKKRQEALEPLRINKALEEIKKLDLKIVYHNSTQIIFYLNMEKITFFPYSGWFSGKGLKDGRGLNNLLTQLRKLK